MASPVPSLPDGFTANLHAVPDIMYGKSTRTSLARFALWVGYDVREISDGTQLHPVAQAIVSPETPYSVLPYDLRIGLNLQPGPPPRRLQGLSPPTWRGVACDFGSLTLWLRDENWPNRRPTFFQIAVLLPRSAPAASDQLYWSDELYLLLGADFFMGKRFRARLRFDRIVTVTHPVTGRTTLLPTVVCGRLRRR